MAAGDSFKGPKPWVLTEEETFSSFSKWQSNMVYTLSKDKMFAPFLQPGVSWLKFSTADPHRGFTDDAGADGLKKEDKAHHLSLMLSHLAQWVPHYLSFEITHDCTSMNSIWQAIRAYYGFQQSEVQFMAYSQITWEGRDKERPERLYRRILSHLHDNLLHTDSQLEHNGAAPSTDEDMSPTVERLAVLRWMELLHPQLPQLVARTFAYDLQRRTLKDLQPQIAQGLPGFLDELQREDVQVSAIQQEDDIEAHRVYSRSQHRFHHHTPQRSVSRPAPSRSAPPRKQCRICKAEGRNFMGHDMSSCIYLSPYEKTQMIRSRSCDIAIPQETDDTAPNEESA